MTGWSERGRQRRAYGCGVAVALVTSVLIVWTTIVRDDGNGLSSFMLILAAAVGAFAAWFRPNGMARTMLGVAIMQGLLGIGLATAPSIARAPDGALKTLVTSGVLTALWLIAAAFFRAAARIDP